MRFPGRVSTLAAFAAGLAGIGVVIAGLVWLDRTYPPPLEPLPPLSVEVTDRGGRLLRVFATPDERWRLDIRLEDVDPQFLDMLIRYEDRRYWSHSGVDVIALARAAAQFLRYGRIVSGGSTITMQLARLIEPRPRRTLAAKVFQIVRALQIERRLSKPQILERYLVLAPYGGNLEGIRAASLAYFGRDPKKLTLSQSALLVALPQSPERRRPDRHPEEAKTARDRVLSRMAEGGTIETPEVDRAAAQPVLQVRRAMPAHAAHLAARLRAADPSARRHETTLRRDIQSNLETVARETAERVGTRVSVAMVLADGRNGEILAQVGSAGFFDAARAGRIDMTGRVRSPGSTLKPFIYGMALEDGLVHPQTLIDDRPANFAGYRPENFDLSYQGEVSVRQALQMSLNVPAVRLLKAVGPGNLLARFRRAGITPKKPVEGRFGLALGLGGVGLRLTDLVQLYTGFVNHGYPARLRSRPVSGVSESRQEGSVSGDALIQPAATWQVADILSEIAAPPGARKLEIAYKTGTSYGYRDAWAIGFSGRYVLGIWIGRPDNGSVPKMTGYGAAAPALFEAFARSGLPVDPLPGPPPGVKTLMLSDLPPAMRRYSPPSELPKLANSDPSPQIVYPPAGARVDLGRSDGAFDTPLVVKIQGGRGPFRWLVNGAPLAAATRRRNAMWMPDGAGFSTVTVIDSRGRSASVDVFIE